MRVRRGCSEQLRVVGCVLVESSTLDRVERLRSWLFFSLVTTCRSWIFNGQIDHSIGGRLTDGARLPTCQLADEFAKKKCSIFSLSLVILLHKVKSQVQHKQTCLTTMEVTPEQQSLWTRKILFSPCHWSRCAPFMWVIASGQCWHKWLSLVLHWKAMLIWVPDLYKILISTISTDDLRLSKRKT